MNGHRVLLGLCMLCALLISAFAAQSASAVTKGTTGFTCKETGAGGGFTKAHCKPSDAGSGNFSHVAIAQDTTTEIKISSDKTSAATNECTTHGLKGTIGGVATELSTCEVHGEGWMENRIEPSGEHFTESRFTLTYTNVKVTKPSGCKVYTDVTPGPSKGTEGLIHTQPLKMTTTGQGDSVKIEPVTGNVILTFILDGCTFTPLNKTYELTGSLTCKLDGATLNCSHEETTAQSTLKLNGTINAGYNGAATVSSKAKPDGSFTALSTTTVETM